MVLMHLNGTHWIWSMLRGWERRWIKVRYLLFSFWDWFVSFLGVVVWEDRVVCIAWVSCQTGSSEKGRYSCNGSWDFALGESVRCGISYFMEYHAKNLQSIYSIVLEI
jgi:hypothetical protein